MAQEVLLTLGDYQFSMDTAAHDQLQRSTSYLWKQQQRLGRDAAQQFLGKQSESIKLSGTIYPHFRGGLEQMAELREAANEGEPLGLVDGRGNNLGQWVVKQITESESNYIAEGLPRKIDFSLDLESYGEDAGDNGGGDGGNGGGLFGWLTDLL